MIKAYRTYVPKLDPLKERMGNIHFAESAGKARYLAYLELHDIYPDLRLIDIQVKRA